MDTQTANNGQEMMKMAELIGRLSSENTEDRKMAALHLARFNERETIYALANALGDPNPEVARKAAESLLSIGGSSLMGQLMSDMLIWDS